MDWVEWCETNLTKNALNFLRGVIAPTLDSMGFEYSSPSAKILLLATALHESEGLKYDRQLGGGAAISPFQIEPPTIKDVVGRYCGLGDRAQRLKAGVGIAEPIIHSDWLDALDCMPMFIPWVQHDRRLACAIARLKYRMAKPPLPHWQDTEGQAMYWDLYYHGAGEHPKKRADFIRDWRKFALGEQVQ